MISTQLDDLQGPALVVFRGLPASGKTTEAKRLILAAPEGHVVRVNRDDLRRSMYVTPTYGQVQEEGVTAAQHAMIEALLQRGAVVISDDTNLIDVYLQTLWDIAFVFSAKFVVVDDFLRVSPSRCVSRDGVRAPAERVGRDVILSMWQRYLTQQEGKRS
jgi:tRNA uridine 5-carbamoylmethylation protein Kti12